MYGMKNSVFNFIYPFEENKDSKVLIFNARSGAMATLDEKHYLMYNKFIEDNIEIPDEEFKKNLKVGGFILPDDLDEQELIRLRLMENRFNTDNFSMTIAPTMDCNFRCIYCYEKNNLNSTRMTEKVQDKIVEHLKSRINTVRNVHIAWYGGEPTLAFDIIKSLSKRLIKVCDDNNVTYSANIVTNGYNLSQDIANCFRDCKIQGMQITLDGPRDIHDTRRPLLGGQGTFDKIISNLKYCVDKIDNISIRINTDVDNATRINEIINELKENGIADKVKPYLGFVEATNDGYIKEKCMTVEMYSKKHLDFIKNHKLDIFRGYPRVIGNYCGADCVSSLIVDPEGYLYKCWNDIGMKENSIGNILDDNPYNGNISRYVNYMMYDPTHDSRCVDCNMLPICMGGCPHKRIISVDGCCEQKFTLQEYLIECAKYIISQREEKKLTTEN